MDLEDLSEFDDRTHYDNSLPKYPMIFGKMWEKAVDECPINCPADEAIQSALPELVGDENAG
jgi:hypothetical protein